MKTNQETILKTQQAGPTKTELESHKLEIIEWQSERMQRRHFKITDLGKELDTMAGRGRFGKNQMKFLVQDMVRIPRWRQNKQWGKSHNGIERGCKCSGIYEMNPWNQEVKWVLHKQTER